ncbi:hypothetical protein [Flavimaricola marinus]|uniref:Uncharacterized protein n=1 Tax=Flavimaricola marinus TaxID=1819565 RepID=A0A238LGA2_9RHOB|nr:hypothetical protein [Flavimaricola marinus]SMY07920.1 hypothetical protein LOM8899_02065 [Flavimaricola marinus]
MSDDYTKGRLGGVPNDPTSSSYQLGLAERTAYNSSNYPMERRTKGGSMLPGKGDAPLATGLVLWLGLTWVAFELINAQQPWWLVAAAFFGPALLVIALRKIKLFRWLIDGAALVICLLGVVRFFDWYNGG